MGPPSRTDLTPKKRGGTLRPTGFKEPPGGGALGGPEPRAARAGRPRLQVGSRRPQSLEKSAGGMRLPGPRQPGPHLRLMLRRPLAPASLRWAGTLGPAAQRAARGVRREHEQKPERELKPELRRRGGAGTWQGGAAALQSRPRDPDPGGARFRWPRR